MPCIRVLVVDDSSTSRRLISEGLAAEPTIDVVGVAANGEVALERIAEVNPHLVTLDVVLPELDGLQTLIAIRKSYPHLPVIMLSTLTERAARVTLEALALGATDYATKPLVFDSANGASRVCEMRSSQRSRPCVAGSMRKSLKRCLRWLRLCDARQRRSWRPSGASNPSCRGYSGDWRVHWRPQRARRTHAALSSRLPVPIVIVQHMPPIFTRLLADRLTAQSLIKMKGGLE